MAKSKTTLVPKSIKSILTFRYDYTQKPILPKLTWRDFTEKQVTDPENHVEKIIVDSIKKNLGNLKSSNVCIALSGGIDSTLTLCLLRKSFADIKINALSVKFANSVDESNDARIIADKFSANHQIMYIENYFRELPKAISVTKLPFWDLHWYHVAKKAKTLSNVIVSGDGGDELFGGYTFRYKKFLSLINPNSPYKEKIQVYLQCHERDWVPDQTEVFGKKIRFSWDEMYGYLKPYFDNPLPPLAQVFLADFNGKLLYNWLPLYSQIHKHFTIKSLTPILSKKMISYATHIPHELKYDDQKQLGKLLLRNILDKYIKNKLLFKNKQGFSVDTKNFFNSYGYDLCKYYLSNARTTKAGLINNDWIKKHLRKVDDAADIKYVNKFLGLLALEIWFRLFVTKEMKPNTVLS